MRALLCLAALWLPAAAGAELALRENVLATQPRLRLGDVAEIRGEGAPALAALELGNAPRVGYVARWTRQELQELLLRRGARGVDWSGAQQVQVRTAARLVTAAEQLALAVPAVQAAFGADGPLQATPLRAPAEVEAPLDAQLAVRPLAGRPLTARFELWLDVLWQGTVYRSLRLALALDAPRRLYVARHDLAPGALLTADDFDAREGNAALAAGPAAGAWLPGARLRQALRAGQPLAADQVLAPGTLRRGEHAVVRWQAGALQLERDGIALGDALPGEAVHMRMTGGAVLAGRLRQDGTVQADRE
jgi:flagella basal body P-ring formation protein FlgA